MLSLLLTLFISLFSVGTSIHPIEDYQENIIYINESKNINYSGGYNEHTGYVSTYFDLSCYDVWFQMENTFSNVYSDFTTDYGSFKNGAWVNCSGLYINVPNYYIHMNSYDDMYSYSSTNGLLVTRVFVYNRVYSPWAVGFDNGADYYAHRLDIEVSNGDQYIFTFYKSTGNYSGSGCYSLNVQLYSGTTHHTDEFPSFKNYSLFATDNFTFGNVFQQKDYWQDSITTQDQIDDAYRNGYNTGVNIGKDEGYESGFNAGKSEGYQQGLVDGASTLDYNSTALTIFNGIFDVGLLPVNVFLTLFNFELFGVNIAGIVSGLLTLSVVIIIVRFLLGGKKDD